MFLLKCTFFTEADKECSSSKPSVARLVYVKCCQMMSIPVSKSLYKSLSLTTVNLKYHNMSEHQFKALATALAVSFYHHCNYCMLFEVVLSML